MLRLSKIILMINQVKRMGDDYVDAFADSVRSFVVKRPGTRPTVAAVDEGVVGTQHMLELKRFAGIEGATVWSLQDL